MAKASESTKKKKTKVKKQRKSAGKTPADFKADVGRELAKKIFKTEKKIIKLEAQLAGAQKKLDQLKNKFADYTGTAKPSTSNKSNKVDSNIPSPYSAPPNPARPSGGANKPSRLF